MSIPFYVPPEQLVKDRAEFARKGIARGRSIVAMEYDQGILILAENPSDTLHKISEIYDRVAFAGVGKFNEFESLRVAGTRHADLRGYLYSRSDVKAKTLANAFSQTRTTSTASPMTGLSPTNGTSARSAGNPKPSMSCCVGHRSLRSRWRRPCAGSPKSLVKSWTGTSTAGRPRC